MRVSILVDAWVWSWIEGCACFCWLLVTMIPRPSPNASAMNQMRCLRISDAESVGELSYDVRSCIGVHPPVQDL